jgi:hypothetical protein
MCKLITAEHVNALLGTEFTRVELYKTNVKFGKYNIDIVFKADDKFYILEVDGVYWHGLILQQLGVSTADAIEVDGVKKQIRSDIANIEKHRHELQSRLNDHIKKSEFLDLCAGKANVQLKYQHAYHLTDVQISKYIKDNKLIVPVDNKDDIKPRDALRGGKVECYVHYKKINTDTHCMRGFDLTSLYPSMMLHNLPLKDSVIVDGGDNLFIQDLYTYAVRINGDAQ